MVVEIIIDDSCIGCGRCRKICPKGPRIWDKRFTEDDKLVYFAKNPYSCLFCKNCVAVCPVDAITVVNRRKFY